MPTANGFIRSVTGNHFTSTFLIDDIQYHFSGNINPAAPAFISNEAVLEYTSVAQLTTQRAVHGRVGLDSIEFTIANGPVITGALNSPIHPAARVSGHGTWAAN